MLSRSFLAAFVFSCLFAGLPASVFAQTAPAQQPGYTFHVGTRIVLTDVTVTDRHGNPVHSLKASQFHIFDNGKPQTLASFEEHATTPVATPSAQANLAPGVFSNGFLEHLPPVLNIVVIDTTNLEIPDQMYLSYKLTQFLKQLPPGQPLAIYWRTGPASILLQSFTSDHELLLAAVRKALPHFPPVGRFYYSDFDTLYKIAVDFGQYPGRKNILWFSGGSTLYLSDDPTSIDFLDPRAVRLIYDELESSRIAVYPIDARGLTVTEGRRIWNQHALMNDIAEATGGQAYYNNNGFDQTASHWLNTDGSFYTLTYSPQNLRLDNKWHKVQIKLDSDGPVYTLSYRRGYFADGSTGVPGQRPGELRTRLFSHGKTATQPDLQSVPIIFQASVMPASEAPLSPSQLAPAAQLRPKRGTIPYTIRYLLPAKDFTLTPVNGKQQIVLAVAVVAFNSDGANIARLANKLTLTIDPDKLRLAPNTVIPVDQPINLHKGENFLYFAVWDMASGRLGTLQVPMQVAAARKN